MFSTQLLQVTRDLDWHAAKSEDLVFGTYQDYLFTAQSEKKFTALITPVAGISPGDLAGLTAWLERQRTPLKLRNYEFTANFLAVRLHEGLIRRSAPKLIETLDLLCEALETYHVPKGCCAICGETAGRTGLYQGLYCHLHPECLDSVGKDFTATDPETRDAAETANPIPSAAALRALADSMQDYRDDFIEDTMHLCRIPSVKGEPTADAPYGEATIQALEAFFDIAQRHGFDTVNVDNRAGYAEFGSGDEMVAAVCHLDVVPAGDGWVHDAFDPVLDGDILTGRGTNDDKGPAMMCLYAMKALKDQGFEPDRRIRLIVGLDEEQGSSCLDHYRETQEIPVAGFTSDANFPVIYAEKGILHIRFRGSRDLGDQPDALVSAEAGSAVNMVPGACTLRWREDHVLQEPQVIEGKSAHASTPQEGVNAIAKAIDRIQLMLEEAATKDPFVDFFVEKIGLTTDGSGFDIATADESGALTLNAGMLKLDPEHFELSCDIRYPVTADSDAIIEKLEQQAAKAGYTFILDHHASPLHLEKDSQLVQTLMDVYNKATETEGEAMAIGGGTYARSLPNIVAYGPNFPGDPDVAHKADEHISIDKALAAAAIYRDVLRKLATADQPDAAADADAPATQDAADA